MSDSGRSEIEEWISRWNDGYQGGMSIRTASEDARAENRELLKIRSRMPNDDGPSDERMNNPFLNKTPKLTFYEGLKIIIMTILFIPIIRLLLCIIFSILAYLWIKLVLIGTSPINSKGEKVPLHPFRVFLCYPLKLAVRLCLFVCGFYWISIKRPKEKQQIQASIIVANHSSFIDAAFFGSQLFTSAVMKSEVYKAPLIGTLARAQQPIVVDRSSGDGFHAALDEIIRRAKIGTYPPILIFPEGTVSNQFSLTMFKRGAFTPGVPVQPVILRYPFCHFDISWGPLTSTLWQFYRMLCQVYNVVTAEYLPVYIPSDIEKSNPSVYAENVRKVMAECMGAPISNHDLSDTLLLRRASISMKQYLSKHVIPIVEMNVLKHVCDLNYDNVEALLEKFKKADKNDTGKINFEQFCQVLDTTTSSRYANTLFNLLHPSEGGYIDFKDLCFGLSLLSNTSTETLKENDKNCLSFSIYDKDGLGYITEDNIATVVLQGSGMTSAANTLPTIKTIFEKFGANGKINFEAYCQAVKVCPELISTAKLLLVEKPFQPSPEQQKKINKEKAREERHAKKEFISPKNETLKERKNSVLKIVDVDVNIDSKV